VGAGRLAHCERTAALCRDVAAGQPALGIDPERAALAGLVHDWGRGEGDGPALVAYAERAGIAVSDAARREPLALLHAPVGAHALRARGLGDEDVLRAVAYHTVGRPGMTRLEMLVYTADFCEPGRGHEGAAGVRAALSADLIAAARQATAHTLRHLLERGRAIELGSVETWNDLVMRGAVAG